MNNYEKIAIFVKAWLCQIRCEVFRLYWCT